MEVHMKDNVISRTQYVGMGFVDGQVVFLGAAQKPQEDKEPQQVQVNEDGHPRRSRRAKSEE